MPRRTHEEKTEAVQLAQEISASTSMPGKGLLKLAAEMLKWKDEDPQGFFAFRPSFPKNPAANSGESQPVGAR